MDTLRLTENTKDLDSLKNEAKKLQKNGLPYMMASVFVWTIILFAQLYGGPIRQTNFLTFMASAFMMPLAIIFSRMVKADIFKRTKNPINKLGFLCTMNQNLYIPLAMWACTFSPKAMLMIYAVIFSAHLLPFAWIYNCRAYMAASIVETIGILFLTLFVGNIPAVIFVIAMQIILCICLFVRVRKENKSIES